MWICRHDSSYNEDHVYLALTKIWNAGVKSRIVNDVGSATHLINLAKVMAEIVPKHRNNMEAKISIYEKQFKYC